MANLGELFVQLGVIGDIKPLEDALNKTKEQIALTQTQVKLDNARAKALKKVKQATSKLDKQKIAKAYNNEKNLIMQKAQAAGIQKQITAHKALGQEVGKVIKGIAAFVGAVTAAAYAMNRLTNELVQSNQAFLDLTRTSDIALDTFQKWDSVGKMLGVQNAAQQIEGLNQRLFELRLTGQGARGFQLAGINPMGQDAEGVLEQLRGRIAGMSDTSASYLLQQMGLDPKMLHLLRMSREEFEELGQTMKKYQLTNKQRADIQQMNIQLQIASQKLQYLKDRAILALMPYWVKFVQSFARIAEMLAHATKEIGKFAVKWRGVFIGVGLGATKIQAIAKGVKTFLAPLRNTYAIVLKLTRAIPVFGRIFAKLGGIFSKALFPLTALYLILDDLAVFFSGGKSLIGEIKEWGEQRGGELGEIFSKIFGGDVFSGLKDLWIKLLDIVQDISFEIAKFVGRFLGIPWDDLFPEKTSLEYSKDIDLNKSNTKKITDDMFVKPKSERQAKAQEILRQLQKLQNNKWNTEGDNMRQMHRYLLRPEISKFLSYNNSTSNNNDNRQFSIPITISSNQPAFDIERELRFIVSGLRT